MKKSKTLNASSNCVYIFIIFPAIIIAITYVLLIQNFEISPIIVIAAVLIPIGTAFKHQFLIDLKLTDASSFTRTMILIVLPLVLLLLYPLYDLIVEGLLGTSPFRMLADALDVGYPGLDMSPILVATEDTIFIVYLNLFQFMSIIITFLASHLVMLFIDGQARKPKKEEDPELMMIKLIQNTESIYGFSHHHREKMRDQRLTTSLVTVIILDLLITIILPLATLFMVVFCLKRGYDLALLIVFGVTIFTQFKVTKILIMKMNAYPAIFRFLMLIIIPGIITYILFQVKDITFITTSGAYLDTIFIQLLNIPPDAEPLESGEALVYFLGIGNGLVCLVGIIGFLTRCSSCHHWYDPYKLVTSSGPVGTYRHDTNYYHATGTVTNVHDSGRVDVDVDLKKYKTESEFHTVEIHDYECVYCARREKRKLTTKT